MSQKRKRISEQDVTFLQNSDTRKNKKVRLCRHGFTENHITTHHERVTLPTCKSDGTFDINLTFQKFDERKFVKDKKQNAGKSLGLCNSSGCLRNVIEKVNATKSSNEDSSGMKEVCQKKKSEINRAAGDMNVTSWISVQSSELIDVKEEIPSTFERNYTIENKALPKVKKKQWFKNKYIPPEMCSTTRYNMPTVLDKEKLKKNEIQNIDHGMDWKQKHFGRKMFQMQVKNKKQSRVELEKEHSMKGVDKIKKIKTLPNIESKDMSDQCGKKDVLSEVNSAKEQSVRVVDEESDAQESERKNDNVTQKLSKGKKRKSKRLSNENSMNERETGVLNEINSEKEQNVRVVNVENNAREFEGKNGEVTEEQMRKKKRKSKKLLTEICLNECENDLLNKINSEKEQNARVVNEECDPRESERQSGDVTEEQMSKKKKRKSKRHSIKSSLSECEKTDVLNEINNEKEQNMRVVNEESDPRESERKDGDVIEEQMCKKKKRKSKRLSTENNLNECENDVLNEINSEIEQNVRVVNVESNAREFERKSGEVTEEQMSKKKKRKSKKLLTEICLNECENDLLNEINNEEEQNLRVVIEESDPRESERHSGDVTDELMSKKKKRKSKRHSFKNCVNECEKMDVLNEINSEKEQNVRVVNVESDAREFEKNGGDVIEEQMCKKKKRKSKRLSTEICLNECENDVLNEINSEKEQNVRVVNEEIDARELERQSGDVTEEQMSKKKKRKSKGLSMKYSLNECEKMDVLNEINSEKEQSVRVVNEESDRRESEKKNDNVTEKLRKEKKRKSKRLCTENSMNECENGGLNEIHSEIKQNVKVVKEESDPRESERQSGDVTEEQMSKKKKRKSQRHLVTSRLETDNVMMEIAEVGEENAGNGVNLDEIKEKKMRKEKEASEKKSEKLSLDGGSGMEKEVEWKQKSNETIGRMKKKVIQLSIESENEEEEPEKVNGNASNATFVNSGISKNWCIEGDSEEEEEEDNDFIVDDNYISYDENATSDEEFEETECSSDDCSGSDNEDTGEEEEEEEEDVEEEQYVTVGKKRMASQFLDLEAEEGEETYMEDEEEEASSENDGSDVEDGVIGVEQFIDFEAREENAFVRRRKNVQVIENNDDDEEEEEQQEKEAKKYPEAESLEKTMHIMKKLTRLMTVGVLKSKTMRKQKGITRKENEDKECDSEIRINVNQSIDFTLRSVNGKERTSLDVKSAKVIQELRKQQKVDEGIREIFVEEKLGKKKQRKSATDWGRGYASEPEYVEAK